MGESSTTLFDEILKWVEKKELPNYTQGINKIFSRRFSSDPSDQIEGLGLIEFEKIVTQIFQALMSEPSINLSKRHVKSLKLEDVHAALMSKLPEVNIDEAYVNSFVIERGERLVHRSRRLAEDVFAYLRDDEIPYYYGTSVGIYSAAYSSREDDLHPQLSIRDLNNLVLEIVPDFLI